MEDKILGLHHITAIAGDAQRNYDFYTKVLGLRLLKKTVNFDDPGTYHLYYGDESGTPGTILTFFPWKNVVTGSAGTGMATAIDYAVPAESFEFWKDRFDKFNVRHTDVQESFGEDYLAFQDPDGLKLNLVIPKNGDNRLPWTTNEVSEEVAIRGFRSVTLTLKSIDATAEVLTDILGYTRYSQEGHRYRYKTDAIENGNFVDLIEAPEQPPGRVAGGTNHHVAFRVKDEDVLMNFRKKVIASGLTITEKIDRNYFYSLYFREPGGVLFELATDNPGFAVDEELEALGTSLKLPQQYEENRAAIEKVLPPIN